MKIATHQAEAQAKPEGVSQETRLRISPDALFLRLRFSLVDLPFANSTLLAGMTAKVALLFATTSRITVKNRVKSPFFFIAGSGTVIAFPLMTRG